MIVRLDKQAPVRLGATPIRTTPEGFKVYRGVATYGDVVLHYLDLSPPRDEFVPAEEALSPEAVASLLHQPFSIGHPPELLTAATAREHVVGSVIAAEADLSAKPPALRVDVIVYDAAAQEDIESGRMCELSPGYRCEEEPRLGSHGGRPYQVVQRRRRYNHLSGVARARTVTPDGRPARLDEQGQPAVAAAVGRRVDGVVAAPGPVASYRRDAALREADAGALPDGFTAALFTAYAAAPGGWRGWTEGASWVAFWPVEPAGAGLLWTARRGDGEVVGDPVLVPPALRPAETRAYSPHDRAAEAQQQAARTTAMADQTANDTAAPATDTPDTDANTGSASAAAQPARLDALSPEDAEILKSMSPEAQAAILAAMGAGGMASGESSGPAAAAVAGEAAEEAAEAAEGTTDMDKLMAAINDLTARVAAMEGASTEGAAAMMPGKPMDKTDGAPALATATKPKSKPASAAAIATASAALNPDEVIRTAREEATRVARETFDAQAKLVGLVRTDGHADVVTASDAAKVMLVTITKHLPRLKSAAEADLKAGRMDAFINTYQQAEDVRREVLLENQGRAVHEALAGTAGGERVDGAAAGGVLQFRAPAPRGA